jgi:hypothetical protein
MFNTWEVRFDLHETETAYVEALLQAMDTEDEAVGEQLGKNCEEMMTRLNAARELIREKAPVNVENKQCRQKKDLTRKTWVKEKLSTKIRIFLALRLGKQVFRNQF